MAFDTVYTFLPDKIKLLVGNVYAEGWEKLTINHLYTKNRQVVGIRGKNTKVRNANTAAKVLVSLTQSSDTNKLFQYIVDAEEDYHGVMRFRIQLEDLSGGTLFETDDAYLEGYPKDISFTGTLGIREWTILCDTSKLKIQGNKETNGTLLDNVIDKVTDFF